jgi:hypothetical protein
MPFRLEQSKDRENRGPVVLYVPRHRRRRRCVAGGRAIWFVFWEEVKVWEAVGG